MAKPWEQLVADWATDNGIPLNSAIIGLSGTRAWLAARASHKANATEKEVRYNLSLALAQGGMTPIRVD